MFLSFDQDWMDKYWSTVSPSVVQCLKTLERRENWTLRGDSQRESLDAMNSIAKKLPQLATIPLNEESLEHAKRLTKILAWLPLRTSIAAFGWLNNLGGPTNSWSYAIYIYAKRIELDSKRMSDDKELQACASILAQRIDITSFLKEFDRIFLADSSLRTLMNSLEKRLYLA
ncbi:hypothetical protein BOO92_15960 [Vibrio navarrensis]|uniref:type IVB secretion system protein IcmW n=1 Tax=Vibrio TaxID=662 RepID=UPI001867BBCC|nr:hypothetical protein [Vibrio navarrensis]HAS6100855.1 hypothetical protein [Vibrio vulnificus]EHA1126495.1 hypothetical protein [Vibrio navarrensis]MBE3658173.1 hypothetical protein [Vibrio navarrensis]MBH9740061.1 hypothetical protein [Vibrio navarrensis]HDY8121404.1 hypothetical protein [Vibrio vulnificus]